MVIIEAFNSETPIEKICISIYEYYDGDVALIDDNSYRKKKHINKIIVSIFTDDENTDLEKKSACFYDVEGKFISDTILFDKTAELS